MLDEGLDRATKIRAPMAESEEVYNHCGCRHLAVRSQSRVLNITSTLPRSLTIGNHSTMRFFTIAVSLSAATLASAQLTYNITQALQPGNFAKYRCL